MLFHEPISIRYSQVSAADTAKKTAKVSKKRKPNRPTLATTVPLMKGDKKINQSPARQLKRVGS
jgi:hypothetical protein